MSLTRYYCDYVWLGDLEHGVELAVDNGLITEITAKAGPDRDAVRLAGVTLPGMVNAHSHVFHRALRGVQPNGGTFWTWQRDMYRVAARLDPDSYYALARAVYAEMVLAGIAAVGEFHYLHHGPNGDRYDDANAMGRALAAAARDAGIRLTLLDTLYLRGGFDRELEGEQHRFSDGSVAAWMDRVNDLDEADVVVGAAVHSVRAVDEAAAGAAAQFARKQGMPLHFHLSEQVAENEACIAATGMTPTELLSASGVLGEASTAVHATHLAPGDLERLGGSGTTICVCPSTERDLGDGIGPAASLAAAGCPLALGSDSHAIIDMLEEARLLELHERLATQRRGHFSPAALFQAASRTGALSLGRRGGVLAVGEPADFASVRLDSVRTAGIEDPSAAVLYAATAADVTDVVIDGEHIVSGGAHRHIDDVPRALGEALAKIEG